MVCAVDLGGTNLRAANIDSDGDIHDRVRFPTPRTEDPQEIVSAIISAVNECAKAAANRGQTVDATCIVVPGSVHARTGRVVNAPNVPAIVDFPLNHALTESLGKPVLIENDANAAAVGEIW